MSFPLTCRSCGARLKLPPGCTKKKARCPKCNARMNLTAALDATAYLPASLSTSSVVETPAPPVPAKPARPGKAATPPPVPTPAPSAAEDDPLPHPDPKPAKRAAPPEEREEDPLPYLELNPAPRPAPPPLPAADATLALDESPAPSEAAPSAGPPPFRTPVRVTADSAGLFAGPCEAVLVPHGLFLESVPYRPFLYAPLRSPTEPAGSRAFTVALADGRRLTLEFLGPHAGRIADDAAAFLAGGRPLPDPKEYRRNPGWLLWVALIFAAGLAVGPVVLSQTTELGLNTGLLIGAGFAGVGLVANAAVVLLTRLPVPGKVALMAVVGVLATGVFLFAATAYLAGRKEAEEEKPEPPPPPQPKPAEPPPDPEIVRRRGLPTAIDRAYADGMYRFEEGTDDVTAIGTTPDGAAMLVGYKNGATRAWWFDRLPDIDPFAPGPKADGPVTRIDFDATSAIAYLTCNGGVVAAYWTEPPESPLKIPGDHVAAFSGPGGERFAASRGNAVVIRQVPVAKLRKHAGTAKGFATLAPRDEVTPPDVKAALAPAGQRPTFVAWHPTGQLLAGLPNGNILSWGPSGPKHTVASRDHRAPVKVWAASPGTWDFATADEKGVVGLWENRAMTPRTFTAASGTAGSPIAITQLAFSPTGGFLALADSANSVWVWDLGGMRVIVKTTRRDPVRALAFGPTDDLLLLGNGKAVELWHLNELAKQP